MVRTLLLHRRGQGSEPSTAHHFSYIGISQKPVANRFGLSYNLPPALWARGAAWFRASPCHGEDRESESRRPRQLTFVGVSPTNENGERQETQRVWSFRTKFEPHFCKNSLWLLKFPFKAT